MARLRRSASPTPLPLKTSGTWARAVCCPPHRSINTLPPWPDGLAWTTAKSAASCPTSSILERPQGGRITRPTSGSCPDPRAASPRPLLALRGRTARRGLISFPERADAAPVQTNRTRLPQRHGPRYHGQASADFFLGPTTLSAQKR